mmetsp:Transcript_36052/g.94181  ORF Transcript_36052/g.94181 Transcript_36052/m.94181 type:complete len:271 (-) Transcript_36052:1942-2754(-)
MARHRPCTGPTHPIRPTLPRVLARAAACFELVCYTRWRRPCDGGVRQVRGPPHSAAQGSSSSGTRGACASMLSRATSCPLAPRCLLRYTASSSALPSATAETTAWRTAIQRGRGEPPGSPGDLPACTSNASSAPAGCRSPRAAAPGGTTATSLAANQAASSSASPSPPANSFPRARPATESAPLSAAHAGAGPGLPPARPGVVAASSSPGPESHSMPAAAGGADGAPLSKATPSEAAKGAAGAATPPARTPGNSRSKRAWSTTSPFSSMP